MKNAPVRAMPEVLRAYARDIGRHPLLTAEEEQRLARALPGDAGAVRRLVCANLRFVVKIAHEYRSYGLCISDLVQEGNVGLLKAVQRFDPDRGIRLISYAVVWIRAHIHDHILRSWSLVRLGTTAAQRKLFFSLARARRELERVGAGKGDAPDAEALALALGVKPGEVEEMSQRMGAHDLSLDAPARDDGNSTLADHVADARVANDEELSGAQQQRVLEGCVASAFAALDRRERFVLEQRLMQEAPVPLKDVAERLGVSRERARQLEVRGKGKLKERLLDRAVEHGWTTAAVARPGRRRGDRSGARARQTSRPTARMSASAFDRCTTPGRSR